ncbi:MAG: 2-oxo acid dehydrogenase subunit E2 [Anaerolineae bacterium]|nr:2-oxo acid dehydrogenase subunit E2 [Anaerolineae bacterium]
MATLIPLPKLGNTVESSIIVRWIKSIGETVAAGDAICEVETDKATMEVESPASGVLLAQLFQPGDDVPVLTNIAVIGAAGEDISALVGSTAAPAPAPQVAAESKPAAVQLTNGASASSDVLIRISPRARKLAERKSLPLEGIAGSGPEGRIIERDIEAALTRAAKLTPLAQSMIEKGGYSAPEGASGRITTKDLLPTTAPQTPVPAQTDAVEVIPLKGARKVIAQRMLESLQTTAQLTLNRTADARTLLDFRKRLKASAPEFGLQGVTINDLILFAVARTLPRFPELNSLFIDNAIHQHRTVHLGIAVDTTRGLIVPVVRNADTLSLRDLSSEAHRLATACQEGRVSPDDLTGGTFSVTNLGSLGIESFTPVLNPPQVAILGVGSVDLKAVQSDDAVQFIPHIALSLTINHQIVDGAPGARFLQALSHNIAQIDLLTAL